MSWSRGGLTGLICRDNNGVHARPLGSSGVEHRPDGATTQEVYNMAKNVFNHQTSGEELAAWSEPAAILKMKTNVWRRGPDRAPDPRLKDFRALKPLILLANSKHNMSKVHIFFYFCQ